MVIALVIPLMMMMVMETPSRKLQPPVLHQLAFHLYIGVLLVTIIMTSYYLLDGLHKSNLNDQTELIR